MSVEDILALGFVWAKPLDDDRFIAVQRMLFDKGRVALGNMAWVDNVW